MNLEIEEIVKSFQVKVLVRGIVVKLGARIIKAADGTFYYVTSQVYKEKGTTDFYYPGAAATTVEEAEDKLFDYLAKFEKAGNDGASTDGNSLYWGVLQ